MPLLLALLASVLLPAGCGEDEVPGTKHGGGSSTAEASPSTDSGGAAEDEPVVRGTGYSFTAPAGWRNAKEQLEGSAARVDAAYAAPTATRGYKTNVNVVRETPPNLVPSAFDDVAATLYKQVQPLAVEGTLTKMQADKLDSAPARAWVYTITDKSSRLRVAQVVALKGDAVYTITFTTHVAGSDRSKDDLEQILRTWRWSS